MKIECHEIDKADRQAYESLNRYSPHGSVFSSLSWPAYANYPTVLLGVFRGTELVGACIVPVSGRSVVRYIPQTPWIGPIARSTAEGECLAIAEALAGELLSRYDEVTLTLPPEWTDIRAFTWAGMRAHVRYTYRGFGVTPLDYEKRVQLDLLDIETRTERPSPYWEFVTMSCNGSEARTIYDWRYAYWFEATPGGKHHSEMVDEMIRRANGAGLGFDMVGCNSPNRGLFKRSFGGRLTPYYAVTTSECKDLREVPVGAAA